MSEDEIQSRTVDYMKLVYPKAWYCASLGGQYQQYYSQRNRAKRTGYIKGFPDLQILTGRGGFFGMFIEIKTHKGRATKQQEDWIQYLNDNNYYAVIGKGLPMILDEIDKYMNKDETNK
nr:VRR-NUC domain-containing protein [Nanoarchaeota archaeon]